MKGLLVLVEFSVEGEKHTGSLKGDEFWTATPLMARSTYSLLPRLLQTRGHAQTPPTPLNVALRSHYMHMSGELRSGMIASFSHRGMRISQ